MSGNCYYYYRHHQHHQQVEPDAQSLLSSAKAMLFRPFQAGLPAPSSWLHPLYHVCDCRCGCCPLASFLPAAPGHGQWEASLQAPSAPFTLWPALLTAPQRWGFLPQPSSSPPSPSSHNCSQGPGPCNSQSSSPLRSLRGLFSPSHCGCRSLRSGWQKLLPGTGKQPPHWSPFLQPLPALPD